MLLSYYFLTIFVTNCTNLRDRGFYVNIYVWIVCYMCRAHIIGHETHLDRFMRRTITIRTNSDQTLIIGIQMDQTFNSWVI